MSIINNVAAGCSKVGEVLTHIIKHPLEQTEITSPKHLQAPDEFFEITYPDEVAPQFDRRPHFRTEHRPARHSLPTELNLRPKRAPERSPTTPSVTVLSPHFKLVFLSVLTLTAASGFFQIGLAHAWEAPTQNQQAAFDAVCSAWKLGLGVIFGLLGGKVA